MDQTLTALIDKKRRNPGVVGEINWDDRRDGYLAAVADLYRQVEAILADPIAGGAVAVHRRAKHLSETYIGTYAIDDLMLVIGDEQVRFSPRGRNIAGAAGRVDVLGEGGEVALLVQPGPRWGVLESRQPTLRVTPFDEQALAGVLRTVMRE